MEIERRIPRRLIRHQQWASGLNALDVMMSEDLINTSIEYLELSEMMIGDDDLMDLQNWFLLQALLHMEQYINLNRADLHQVPVNQNPIDPATVTINNRPDQNFQTTYGRMENKEDLHDLHNASFTSNHEDG